MVAELKLPYINMRSASFANARARRGYRVCPSAEDTPSAESPSVWKRTTSCCLMDENHQHSSRVYPGIRTYAAETSSSYRTLDVKHTYTHPHRHTPSWGSLCSWFGDHISALSKKPTKWRCQTEKSHPPHHILHSTRTLAVHSRAQLVYLPL